MAEGESDLLKTTKKNIRSVVQSMKDGVPASQLQRDFKEFMGGPIPFKKLGYPSVQAFISDIPDVICVKMVNGEQTYFAVADQTTEHLQKLIQKQKSNPKKSKGFRRVQPTRYPKFHSQISRTPPATAGWGMGGSRGGFKPRAKSFGRHRPNMSMSRAITNNNNNNLSNNSVSVTMTPVRVRSPNLQTPGFNVDEVSPLKVTVLKTVAFDPSEESGERMERVIEAAAGNSGGGRAMAQRALKDVQRQKPHQAPAEKKIQYEVPPRFQKQKSSAMNATNTSNSTGGGFRPAEDERVVVHEEGHLPLAQMKQWTGEMVKGFPRGWWWFVYEKKLHAEFQLKEGAIPNLREIVETWTDVADVQLNELSRLYMLFPPEEAGGATSAGEAKGPTVEERMARLADDTGTSVGADEQHGHQVGRRPWQNVIVPFAELFEEKETCQVFASTFNDLGDFYVQRKEACVEQITEMLQDSEPVVAIPRLSDLQPGVFCSALFSLDNCWYRARVLCVMNEQEINIIFIDYGNVETVSLENVRCLTEEVASIPAQAVNCSMFGIKPFEGQKGWSEEAVVMFREVEEKELLAETLSIENGSCVVELWLADSDEQTSMNERLYKHKLVDTYLCIQDPPDLSLPDTGYLEVVVAFVDLKHCWLRMVGKEYSEALEAYEDRLGVLYKEAQGVPPRKLQVGDICIASCDLLYHRIKIKDIRDEQANCFFVDHGYKELVPLNKLVPLSNDDNQLLSYQAIWCSLMGLEVFMSNPITVTQLVEFSKNKICVAETIVREPLKVVLYDTHGADDININAEIARKLNAEGHVIDMTMFTPLDDNTTTSIASTPSQQPSPPLPTSTTTTTTTTTTRLQEIAEAKSELYPDSVLTSPSAASSTTDVALDGPGTTTTTTTTATTSSPTASDVVERLKSSAESVEAGRLGDGGDSSSSVSGGGGVGDIERLESGAKALTLNGGDGGDGDGGDGDSLMHNKDNACMIGGGGDGGDSGNGGLMNNKDNASMVGGRGDGGGDDVNTMMNESSSVKGDASGDASSTDAATGSSSGGVPSSSSSSMTSSSQKGDNSLSVSYNDWRLPEYTPLPESGVFFAVFVQSVVDPSNFVIVPLDVKARLAEMMNDMNMRFNPGFGGDEVQKPPQVPEPKENHLYMVFYKGLFYRAICLISTHDSCNMLLPDFHYHALVAKRDVFFLPKPLWAVPFMAFKASLLGIKRASSGGGNWLMATAYTFISAVDKKNMMAMIKRRELDLKMAQEGLGEGLEGQEAMDRVIARMKGPGSEILQQAYKRVYLHLVDTFDPDTDVVIAELLLSKSSVCTDVVRDLS